MNECKLILGDCLEVMKTLPDGCVDAVVTDPPYGVNLATWDGDIPPQEVLDECLRVSSGAVVWFGAAPKILNFVRYQPQPERMLVWNPAFSLAPTGKNGMHYRYHPIWCWRLPASQKIISVDVIRDNCEGRHWWDHPGTKPISLMTKIVSAFGGATILDPFMGSGTTGVATVKMQRNFIGVEIDPAYFAIAQKRIAEAQMQLPLLEYA